MTTVEDIERHPAAKSASLRPLEGLLSASRIALYNFVACLLVMSICLYLTAETTLFAIPGATGNDAVLTLWSFATVGYYTTFLVSALLVSCWTYRAMRNLHRIDEPYAEMSAGWAVGWYFVPIAALWKPLEGMREIVEGSYHAARRPMEEMPSLASWWAMWIVGSLTGRIAARLPGFGEGVLALTFFSTMCFVISPFLLIGIMSRVTEVQRGLMEAADSVEAELRA